MPYLVVSLIYNQITNIASHGLIAGIIIFFTLIPVILFDFTVANFYVFKLMYDLCVRPLFNKEWREYIKNIIRQNQLVIGYLLGFTFLTPSNIELISVGWCA